MAATAMPCARSGTAKGAARGKSDFDSPGAAIFYEASGRRPSASINLVTAHDGFTLNDLVSYEHKHNEANG